MFEISKHFRNFLSVINVYNKLSRKKKYKRNICNNIEQKGRNTQE